MDRQIRQYIKQQLATDEIAYLTDDKDVNATVSICHAELGDVYTVDVVRSKSFGKTYDYDSLTQCFRLLSRLEREKSTYWKIRNEAI